MAMDATPGLVPDQSPMVAGWITEGILHLKLVSVGRDKYFLRIIYLVQILLVITLTTVKHLFLMSSISHISGILDISHASISHKIQEVILLKI